VPTAMVENMGRVSAAVPPTSSTARGTWRRYAPPLIDEIPARRFARRPEPRHAVL
jgi:hypothetical protein